jgi:uncharacterized protein YukE
MQKNNSTVKKQSKNVSRNALQIIIQELSLSDAQKAKMYEDLRNMGITDDNDPLVKFTMLQGLLAQYNGETAEKVVQERENIEETVEELKELYERISSAIQELRKRDLAELKDSIKLWKNEVIIGTQTMIVELRYEEERMHKQVKKQQEELHKGKEEIYKAKKERDEIKNSCSNYIVGTIAVCTFVVLIAGIIISLIWTFEKNSKVEKYSEAVENCKPTIKVADRQSEKDREHSRKLKEIEESLKSFDKTDKNLDRQIAKSREILQKIIDLDKEES